MLGNYRNVGDPISSFFSNVYECFSSDYESRYLTDSFSSDSYDIFHIRSIQEKKKSCFFFFFNYYYYYFLADTEIVIMHFISA